MLSVIYFTTNFLEVYGEGMRSLGGIVSFCGDIIEPCELDVMRRYGSIYERANLYGGVALFFGGEEQPVECGEVGRRIAVMLDGGISNRDELCRRLTLEDSPTDVYLAAAAYSLMTDGFFGAVSGSYHAAIYDEEKGRVVLAVRGRGRAPIYYIKEGGRFVFSTSLEVILKFGGAGEIKVLVDGDGLIISLGKCEQVALE